MERPRRDAVVAESLGEECIPTQRKTSVRFAKEARSTTPALPGRPATASPLVRKRQVAHLGASHPPPGTDL
jgi:hypothetical protein